MLRHLKQMLKSSESYQISSFSIAFIQLYIAGAWKSHIVLLSHKPKQTRWPVHTHYTHASLILPTMSHHVIPLSVHNSAQIGLKHKNEVHMTPSVLRFTGTPSASVWVSKHLSSLQRESSSLVLTGNRNKGANPRRGNAWRARPIFGWYIQRYTRLTIYHKPAASSQEISALLPQFWFYTFVKCSTDRKEALKKQRNLGIIRQILNFVPLTFHD